MSNIELSILICDSTVSMFELHFWSSFFKHTWFQKIQLTVEQYYFGYNPKLPYLFVVQIIPVLTIDSSFCWFLGLSEILPLLCFVLFLNNLLSSGTTQCSRLLLYISCQNLTIRYFSKVLLLKNGIKNQYLSVRCACCHWVSLFLAFLS